MIERKHTQKDAAETGKFPRWQMIAIIVFIILALLGLLFSGGNNQTWYPGKPYNER